MTEDRRDELRAELTAIILRCDRNAWNYAEQIIDALLESGWITPEDPPPAELPELGVTGSKLGVGLRVPEGLTADALREAADAVRLRGGDGAQRRRNFVLEDSLREWASVLDGTAANEETR